MRYPFPRASSLWQRRGKIAVSEGLKLQANKEDAACIDGLEGAARTLEPGSLGSHPGSSCKTEVTAVPTSQDCGDKALGMAASTYSKFCPLLLLCGPQGKRSPVL